MTTNIAYCGYSYHTQRFNSHYTSGYPTYLFRLQTEGISQVILKDGEKRLEKGDLLFIKPGDHYELLIEATDQSGDYHLICDGPWIDEWWQRSKKPVLSRIELDEKLLSLWRSLMMEVRRPASERSLELSDYLVRALCLSLERAVNETAPSFQRPYAVTKMMRYIEEHATTSFKVEEVAQHAGLSVSRAVHLFKEATGKTMIEYTQEIRLSASIERMKHTAMTLEQIAEDCGFGTYPYFHRVFSKKYGVAPGVYRRKE